MRKYIFEANRISKRFCEMRRLCNETGDWIECELDPFYVMDGNEWQSILYLVAEKSLELCGSSQAEEEGVNVISEHIDGYKAERICISGEEKKGLVYCLKAVGDDFKTGIKAATPSIDYEVDFLIETLSSNEWVNVSLWELDDEENPA